jgi:hypothetical protein
MGTFFDDMANFCEPGDEERFATRFVEIASVRGIVEPVQPQQPRAEHLDAFLGTDHPIVRHISTPEGQADGSEEDRVFVPWNELWFRFKSLAADKEWQWRCWSREIDGLLPRFTTYLEKLSGCFLPIWASDIMCQMAAYARVEDEQDVKDLIKVAYDQLVDEIRAARASSPTDAPAPPLPE